jgi:hypothetical protein
MKEIERHLGLYPECLRILKLRISVFCRIDKPLGFSSKIIEFMRTPSSSLSGAVLTFGL